MITIDDPNRPVVTQNDEQININVESTKMFDDIHSEHTESLRNTGNFKQNFNKIVKQQEIIPSEFRTSAEIEENPEFMKKMAAQNEYLLNLDQELENVVVINRKKAIKGFQKFSKRLKDDSQITQKQVQKMNFFSSNPKHRPVRIISDNFLYRSLRRQLRK